MKKVFWENPYQSKLVTKVAAIDGNDVLFEDTIAYSFVGGQESDKATINDIPVLNSRIEGNVIYYTLPENHGFAVGDQVMMEIDWPRRNRLMRLHFAAELILEIVTQKFGFEKVGAHIAENKARIDFVSPESISPKLLEILAAYNKIIDQDVPIEKGYLDGATQRRFWRIENFAQVPCGGTHVDSTAEVGYVTLKREHPGKSIERIEIRLVNAEPTSESKNSF
jgi:Ser-tRNA(Ala) deacylase AlaX